MIQLALWIVAADLKVYEAGNVPAGQQAGLIPSNVHASDKSGARGLLHDLGFDARDAIQRKVLAIRVDAQAVDLTDLHGHQRSRRPNLWRFDRHQHASPHDCRGCCGRQDAGEE